MTTTIARAMSSMGGRAGGTNIGSTQPYVTPKASPISSIYSYAKTPQMYNSYNGTQIAGFIENTPQALQPIKPMSSWNGRAPLLPGMGQDPMQIMNQGFGSSNLYGKYFPTDVSKNYVNPNTEEAAQNLQNISTNYGQLAVGQMPSVPNIPTQEQTSTQPGLLGSISDYNVKKQPKVFR